MCDIAGLAAGKLPLVMYECARLPEKSRRELLQLLLPKRSCRNPLLSFLMLQAWESKPVDCSKISLHSLLTDKKLTNPNLLVRFMECGAAVAREDIALAIQCLSSDDILAFKTLLSKCEGFDMNQVCREAASANKIPFVLHLVELGADPPICDEGVKLFKEALKVKEFNGAKVLVGRFSKETLRSLELGELLDTTNLVMSVELVKMLITGGVGMAGKPLPIPAVLSCTIGVAEKMEVICLMVECGMDCKQLCHSTHKTTTPLHVATDLALKAGE